MKISDLTIAERLLIARRRLGESQQEAADRLAVTLYRYRQLEAGMGKIRAPKLGELAEHEICLVRRRRAGISLRELAKALGTSCWWVTQMEYGRAPVERLVRYWQMRRAG